MLSISYSVGYPGSSPPPPSQVLELRVSVTVFFSDREREGSLGSEELEREVWTLLRLSGTSLLHMSRRIVLDFIGGVMNYYRFAVLNGHRLFYR